MPKSRQDHPDCFTCQLCRCVACPKLDPTVESDVSIRRSALQPGLPTILHAAYCPKCGPSSFAGAGHPAQTGVCCAAIRLAEGVKARTHSLHSGGTATPKLPRASCSLVHGLRQTGLHVCAYIYIYIIAYVYITYISI